jgi:FkbM family methyltransferase
MVSHPNLPIDWLAYTLLNGRAFHDPTDPLLTQRGPGVADALSFLSVAFQHREASKAQLFQDLWVLHELEFQRNGFFLEIGASDGLTHSNTWLLEKQYGWQGILAEPNPVHHQRLMSERSASITTKCIASRSDMLVDFLLVTDPFLATISGYGQDDVHSPVRSGAPMISIPTLSPADLLSEMRAPPLIDYLSLDTEGSELDILRAFPFDAYTVKLVTVEHNMTKAREELYALLVAKGFRRKFESFSLWDDWYVRG